MQGGSGEFGTIIADSVAKDVTDWYSIVIIIAIIITIVIDIGCVFLCRYLAKNKNLSTNYMWLGFFSLVGVLIVAAMPPGQPYNPYYGDPNMYNNQNMYGNQNMYNNQNMYSNQNMYNAPQGVYNNVQQMPQMFACPICGAQLNQTDAFCVKCGNKVR